MAPAHSFFVVDDDQDIVNILKKVLEMEGHQAFGYTSSLPVMEEILRKKPDCILLDMLMPELDGLTLLKQIRNHPDLQTLKVVIVSGKAYEVDRKRAYDCGADGYITKPVNMQSFPDTIRRVMADRIQLSYWGVHGTMPVPGPLTVKYGGNTSCVSMEFPRGGFFIFDAGTGIKVLSNHIMANSISLVGAKLFISHPHWDHINGLPFFVPLYLQGNEIEILGPAHGDTTMRDLISGQMDGAYFPVNIKEFSAMVSFRDLREGEIKIDGIRVKSMLLNHPGNCLGYRVEYRERVICYITDNELYPAGNPLYNAHYLNQLSGFIKHADVLITDCTYTDEEYEGKSGWGHSSITPVVELAHRSRVKSLHLFHHDPDHSDDDIDRILETAQSILHDRKSGTRCIAPREAQHFQI